MPKCILHITNWTSFPGGWGPQIGVAEIRLHQLPPGMHMRLAVFRTVAGEISCGMALIPGVAPSARYNGIWFIDDADRRQFLAAFIAELKTAALTLFGVEERP